MSKAWWRLGESGRCAVVQCVDVDCAPASNPDNQCIYPACLIALVSATVESSPHSSASNSPPTHEHRARLSSFGTRRGVRRRVAPVVTLTRRTTDDRCRANSCTSSAAVDDGPQLSLPAPNCPCNQPHVNEPRHKGSRVARETSTSVETPRRPHKSGSRRRRSPRRKTGVGLPGEGGWVRRIAAVPRRATSTTTPRTTTRTNKRQRRLRKVRVPAKNSRAVTCSASLPNPKP